MFIYENKVKKENSVTLSLPNYFSFKNHDVFVFDSPLSFFNWELKDVQVKIDLQNCSSANYQTLALLVPYIWHLKANNCTVSVLESSEAQGASKMWRNMGGRGAIPVLISPYQNFHSMDHKPMIAVRDDNDFKAVIQIAEEYTKGFNIEYGSTLRYILSELLYNTLEHGRSVYLFKGSQKLYPSLVQFTYYATRNELQFLIVDLGIGIKKHIEQAYPGQEDDVAAIKLSLRPQVSGTFNYSNPYRNKNNAGVGLYISSNIVRRLNASMHIISGYGLVHISPRDITGKTLENRWPGTAVLVNINLEHSANFKLHKLMQEFRESAQKEQNLGDMREQEGRVYISISNEFGSYAEYKPYAIRCRDNKIFPGLSSGKDFLIDFEGVTSAPHSFLSALLASPIKSVGMMAFKKFKIVNASPEIRETLDFILEENT